jgi:hypothetical protein
MADNRSRRDVLKLMGLVGVTWATTQWAATQLLAGQEAPAAQPVSSVTQLLPDYHAGTRRNIVTRHAQRAMLSSQLYPKATFVRDAFYGPLALNDVALSAECLRWFVRAQLPTGQIRTAVPFAPADEADFAPGDDDSSLLFIIWSAWLKRNRAPIDLAAIALAWSFVQTHVRDGQYVTPAGPFRYWADTVLFEQPERIAHNQGLYVLALRAMRFLDAGRITDQQLAQAKAHYASFYRSDLGALTLGKDSAWAATIDLSALFPEFLLRWLYDDTALPDAAILATVDRFRQVAAVPQLDGSIAGIKIICAANGDFLDRQRFYEPGLNWPGDYHNGGYWPMYTLTAFALAYRLTREPALKRTIEQLITIELGADHQSKEVIILAPGAVGTVNPDRSNYTWNALIVPALKWAGVV